MAAVFEPTPRAFANGMPFAQFAQIVRMLVPLADKVGFYDHEGEALWISDGVDEPALRGNVEALLAAHNAGPVHVEGVLALPIRDAQRRMLGVLGLVRREMTLGVAAQGPATIEKLLTPLLAVIAFAWRAASPSAPPAQQASADPLDPANAPPPTPAVLRRTLTLAVQRIDCSFGAVVLVDHPFTLSHRVSPDESDVAVNAAIDTMRAHMIKLMQVRREPLLMNRAVSGPGQSIPRKFLIYPVRSGQDRLTALIMLFRDAQDRDFVRWDIEALSDIAGELSEEALATFARPTMPQGPVHRAAPTPASAQSAPQSSAPAIRVQPITMDARIRMALREDAFDLHAQPIAALRGSGAPDRFEVLLRMHENEHVYGPSVFFDAAQSGRLMPELDRWVVRSLLQRLRERAALVRTGQWEFCINIAAQSLTADRFSEFVVAEVCRSSIPPGLLVFEFSERNALEHSHAVEVMAARLRDVGCRIALDNCRGGFDTLSTLRKWPVSCVKIDGSLIRDVVTNPRSESLVRAVVDLARGVGVETVAECVESEAIRAKLHDIGVDYAQGFHLGRPRPIEGVLRTQPRSS